MKQSCNVAPVSRRTARGSLLERAGRSIILPLSLLGLGAGSTAALNARSAPTPPTAAAASPGQNGSALYAAHCAACHGGGLAGGQFGSSLKGTAFLKKWGDDDGAALLTYIRTNMPPARPNSLSPDEYAAISQLILQSNGRRPLQAAAASKPAAAGAVQSVPTAVPANSGNMVTENRAILDKYTGPKDMTAVALDATAAEVVRVRENLLQGLTPVTDEILRSPKDGEWLMFRRTYDQISFSPLPEIDKGNVGRLSVAWAWALPVGSNEIEPLVHDGVMFVQSDKDVQALNAKDGTLLWKYVRDVALPFQGSINAIHRNMSIYGTSLYISTADRHVVSLDAKTGKVEWDQEIAPASSVGLALTAGPLAANGKIVQTVAGGPNCIAGCFVVGLDAKTGEQLWRFNTIPKPGEANGDSWNNTPLEARSGGGVWGGAPAYDPQTNLIYFGVGGSYKAATLLTPKPGKPLGPNDALYTNSTIALDLDTGKLAWYHQHLPRDVWDLDEALERPLFTLSIDGVDRKLVGAIGKLGILDILDRGEGQFVFAKDFGIQNLIASIDPKTGVRTRNPSKEPKPDVTTEICPSTEGAKNWMTSAYNPRTRVMYEPLLELCMDYTWQPNKDATDFEKVWDISWTSKPVPNSDGKFGRLEAFDLAQRKTLWVRRWRAPLSSSLLATAGGLLFTGDRDRMFRALDADTGATLWETRLSAVPNSSPITYRLNGQQYIAVATGGGGPNDGQTTPLTPEIRNSAPSTTLWVFRLSSPPTASDGASIVK